MTQQLDKKNYSFSLKISFYTAILLIIKTLIHTLILKYYQLLNVLVVPCIHFWMRALSCLCLWFATRLDGIPWIILMYARPRLNYLTLFFFFFFFKGSVNLAIKLLRYSWGWLPCHISYYNVLNTGYLTWD
jgi:hypothetical protein